MLILSAVSHFARKTVFTAYSSIAREENVDLLERALKVRSEIAQLMGFKNWSQYRVQEHLLDGPGKVDELLKELEKPLKKVSSERMRQLSAFKKTLPPPGGGCL